MILKASQRGGAKQLALHLQRTDDNDHIEIHEVRGFISDNLTEAMKEAYAVSRGTRCKQFLFSVSLNPPEDQDVKIEIFEDAIERIETKTGLSGQPRVIVFHEKEGRRHAHAVWSRIDAETMTARNMSLFKSKLKDIARDLYLENDWKMPRGFMNSQERDPRNFSLDQWQQAKRMGYNARDLKAMLQECWAVSDSRAAFTQVLQERGLTLAKGDRRTHVAVTHDGEVLSIARYVGKKAKEITAKLGKPDDLPGIDRAKAQFAKDMRQTFRRHVNEAKERKRRAMEPLENRRQAMVQEHRQERAKLSRKQKDRLDVETCLRSARLQSGMRGIWQRLSGEYTRIRKQNEQETYAAFQRDRRQREVLIFAQMHDRRNLQRQIKTVRKQHADLFRDIRQDQHKYRQIEKAAPQPSDRISEFNRLGKAAAQRTEPIRPSVRSTADRLSELRQGSPKRSGQSRDRGPER